MAFILLLFFFFVYCTPSYRLATAGNSKCVYPSVSMEYPGDKIYDCYSEQDGGVRAMIAT